MSREGTVGHATTLSDGSRVYIDAAIVDKIKARQTPKYFTIRECFDWKSCLIVYVAPPTQLRHGQTVDVEGTITTLPNGNRAVVSPTVYGYLDSQGKLLYHGPLVKGPWSATPWQWKSVLTTASTAAFASVVSNSPPPPGEPSPDSQPGPIYCATIAEARAAYDPGSRVLVELQCRPLRNPVSGQFVLQEDGSANEITVYYTKSIAATDRVNRLIGTIQRDAGSNYWIEVDSGPNWQAQDPVGSVHIAASGTIAWTKTFADGAMLPTDGRARALEAKTVSFARAGTGFFYIEEANRSAAIKVFSSVAVAAGSVVDIDGTVDTDVDPSTSAPTGERVVNASNVVIRPNLGSVSALGTVGRSTNCGLLNVHTPGTTDGVGLNNTSLFVRTWGKVTAANTDPNSGQTYIYLDDGSSLTDGSVDPDTSEPNVGLRVLYAGYPLSAGDFCVVNGVLSRWADATSSRPLLLTQDANSLIPPIPTAPANLTAFPGNHTVYLQWDAAGSMGFEVYRKPSGGSYSLLGNASGAEYADSTAANGTTYYYYVTARGTTGQSAPSNETSATPNTDAPSISIVQVSQDSNGLMTIQYSPQAGSGTVPSMVAVFVDGDRVWTQPVAEGTTLKYDTTQLNNGLHKLEVRTFASSTDGQRVYTAVASATFTTNNLVCDFQIPMVSTGVEATTARFREECDWTLEFEQGGVPIHSASGTGTSLSYAWDTYGGYGDVMVKLTANPTSAGGMVPASNYTVGGHTYTWYLGGVDSPTYCVHWAREDVHPNQEAGFRESAQYVIEKLLYHPDYGYMFDANFRRRWNDEQDAVDLRDYVIGSYYGGEEFNPCIYYFHGHGGGGADDYTYPDYEGIMGCRSVVSGSPRWWGLAALHDDLSPVSWRFHNLGPAIGNDVQYDQTSPFPGRCYYAYMSRRFKFVMILACHSGDGLLHLAFGMPNRRFTGHGSTYLGFKGAGRTDTSVAFAKRFWDYLENGLCIHAAAEYTKQDLINQHPGDSAWVRDYVIYGDPALTIW